MKPKTLARYVAVSFYLFVSICSAGPVPLTGLDHEPGTCAYGLMISRVLSAD